MKVIRLKNETTGEEKEIQIPDGYDYDKIITYDKGFRNYDGSYKINGYIIVDGEIKDIANSAFNYPSNKDVFATKELAESTLALAQLSQIIEHDTKLNNLHVDKKDVLDVNFLDVLRKRRFLDVLTEQRSNHYVVTVEYNYDKKGIDCSCIELESYAPFDSMVIKDLFLYPNNYLMFVTFIDSEIEIIKEFIKENEDLIRKYLMV